jgi:hypothetical protein
MKTVLGSALLIAFCGILMPGQSANPNATVHFYRRALLAGATKPSVYCDGQDMAHVQSGRILTVEIPA